MKFVPKLPEILRKPQGPSLGEILRGPEDTKLTESQRAGLSVEGQLASIQSERHAAGATARKAEADAAEKATADAYARYLKRADRASRFSFEARR